jgi:dihydrofolate synthase/folylpolyglutamate synthase
VAVALTLDYASAVAALESFEGRGMKLGLERTLALLGALGDPHRRLCGVLVAGTNGKGSVCALVESMARAAGLRTVLLTKPHLTSWCERIALDGRPVAEQRFADLIARVLDAAAGIGGELGSPTVFEVVTAAGIVAAHDAEPDVLVCEVGLGGRLDSANVLDLGVAVVTGIALDHREQLGDDLAGIAAEKAAIIKPGNDLVTAAVGVALDVIRARAEGSGARSFTSLGGAAPWRGQDRGREGVMIEIDDPPLRLATPLIGAFQQRNLAVAAHAARALTHRTIPIPDAAIAGGAAAVRWPGRMQWIEGSPAVLVDACHNTEAVLAMVAAARPLCAGRRTVVVFGAMADKDIDAMVAALRPLSGEVVFTAPKTPRAASPADLARRWGSTARTAPDVASALAVAAQTAGGGGVVVACGSLYVAGEALEAMGALATSVSGAG